MLGEGHREEKLDVGERTKQQNGINWKCDWENAKRFSCRGEATNNCWLIFEPTATPIGLRWRSYRFRWSSYSVVVDIFVYHILDKGMPPQMLFLWEMKSYCVRSNFQCNSSSFRMDMPIRMIIEFDEYANAPSSICSSKILRRNGRLSQNLTIKAACDIREPTCRIQIVNAGRCGRYYAFNTWIQLSFRL